MAKLDADEFPLKEAELDFNEVTREVLIEFLPELSKYNIELQVLIPEATSPIIADHLSLIRIIGNLIKNAIHYRKTGKIVGNYSLGMKQRLGIARALLHYPELLILDEPTNGLDPIGIKEMRKLIKSLAQERNITILISSHILAEVEQLVDRMGIIHEGRLLEEVSLDTLRKANRKYIEFQVNNDNKAAMLLENHFQIFDYEVHDEGNIRIYSHFGQQGHINRTFVLNDVEVLKMMMSEDRLEDYFTKLVGGGTIG